MPRRGHPGKHRVISAAIPSGVFTQITPGVSVYQDSGLSVQVAVQVANLCGERKREGDPPCLLPIDHKSVFHSDGDSCWTTQDVSWMGTA